jgi:hypothetical protein
LAFFLKTNVMIKLFHNVALFRVKNANFFAEFCGENILKIITSVPGFEGFCYLVPAPGFAAGAGGGASSAPAGGSSAAGSTAILRSVERTQELSGAVLNKKLT